MTERDKFTPADVSRAIQQMRREERSSREAEEVLWFLQDRDSKEGLYKLACDLVDEFPENVGSEFFRRNSKQKKLSRAQTADFWNDMPSLFHEQFRLGAPEGWLIKAFEPLSGESEEGRTRELQKMKAFPELDVECLRETLAGIARREIDSRLEEAFSTHCYRIDCWSFNDLPGALRKHMATCTAKAVERIAETRISREVFKALNFAWQQGVMVRIEGDPRYGKTEAIKAYREMYPGRVRLITVPSDATETEFFEAVAEGMGIEITAYGTAVELRRRIDFVLKNSRLLLIFDEAAFLLPDKYSENTAPIRMNWVRTRVADRGLPTALIITPQSFDERFRRYIRKTNYRFEQFLGRTARFVMPEILDKEDVIAVAEKHFPGIALPFLKKIAGRAMRLSGFLQAVEMTAKYALFLASEAGREGRVEEADVIAAIEQMLPCKAAALSPEKEPLNEGESAVNRALPESDLTLISRRGMRSERVKADALAA
ncbi:MAG TPA: AAA family ATPase [Verrucomicrobiae bacterium]|jgi:hypothetical protein|nr:AAA family ATPase [Verrucomicrobiae bacterium]